MDNFDVHEWNKNRYLKRIEESDDPKLGGELEAGVEGDRVEENLSYLEKLAADLSQKYPDLDFEVRFPDSDSRRIETYGSQRDLADFGEKMHGKKFGEYEVFHMDYDDRKDTVRIVKSSSIGRGPVNEAYEPKHFDICPGAQALRKRVVDGEFGDIKEFDLDKWTKLHDALFSLEKKVLKDKEAEDSDVEMAEKLRSEIINLSRDIDIPSEAIGYLKGHVDIIKDISSYSELTESIKETLRFIKENNPEFTNEEIKAELKEIKSLGSQLDEKKSKLCKRGQEYIAARKRAGEKSSAYLSGRGVKVCKGQIKFKGKKQKDFKG